MTIGRNEFLLALALGASVVLAPANVFADEGAGHDHKAAHGHEAMMKSEKKISAELAKLSQADRNLALTQRFCPMMEYTRLGSDGAPIKVMVAGKPVLVCCKGCVKGAAKNPSATLKKAQSLAKASAGLAKLPMKERMAAETQKYCAIANKNFLGSMGAPLKLTFGGKPVYLCCKGCVDKAKAKPSATLATVAALNKTGHEKSHSHKHGDGDHKHEVN